ncbi:MAG: sodium-dependent transporter [Candidatus Omnitrophica bacterium]|nr:sodium-dependent transporter [Candidatus Omnitrophota bacterium]
MAKQRQRWGSKLGIILAVAGSAVGLGNFLRFPVQAAQNGGGAFMIPYFISFLLLGIPLMWIEWTAGRFGGGFEHSTAPGIFHSMWEKNHFIKYFGVIGIFGPLAIFIYYTYIESWCLAYSVFAIMGKYQGCTTQAAMMNFLQGFQGLTQNEHFQGLWAAYLFFVITFVINISVVYYGIKGGIERLCKIAMPALFLFAAIIVLRVFTMGAPDPSQPAWNAVNGLGFLWNPDLSALKDAKVWLAAAGQMFFTLSVGIGVILTYSSYLRKSDDVALSGLSAASTNEFAEVILGGSIIIPAAFAFFGPVGIVEVAKGGAFNLSFVTMPVILQNLPMSAVFGLLWFGMLFLAGVTSSISLAQPAIAFLEDEFAVDRRKAVWIFGIVTFILCQPVIFFLGRGVVNELDFWAGTFCLVVFATVETIVFAWIFGIDKAWEQMHHGAMMRIPKVYKYIIKYVTPVFLLLILGFWLVQEGVPTIMMKGVAQADRPFVLGTRIGLILIFSTICILVKIAWRKRKMRSYS